MDNSLQNITIQELAALFDNSKSSALGKDLFMIDIKGFNPKLRFLQFPCRFKGYVSLFCISGDLGIDINLSSYRIKEKSLVVSTPGNIIRVSEFSKKPNSRFILVGISEDFMSEIKLDFTKLFNDSITILEQPCVDLSEEEFNISFKYLELVETIINSNIANKEDSISDLISSVFYLIGSIWSKQIKEANIKPKKSSTRTKMVFDNFIKLVTEYHNKHRTMAFYADRLCLTPKYLSKLVKEISGRSAPNWIDAFVILEAKNMLKYSDMTIKAIVYKLNFPNQSVFYKFFKSQTGMTPSEYRNS